MIRLLEHTSALINLDYQGYTVLAFNARDDSGGKSASGCYYSLYSCL
jgi:hypothetical protein